MCLENITRQKKKSKTLKLLWKKLYKRNGAETVKKDWTLWVDETDYSNQLTKKTLIYKISLRLKFKSGNTIKLKTINNIVKEILPNYE